MESHPPVSGQVDVASSDVSGLPELTPLAAPGRTGLQPTRDHILSIFRYLFSLEVHVYASSIAANALLSFFPFTLLMLTVCRRWLHWEGAFQVTLQLLRANLPTGADFVVHNLVVLAQGHRRLQVMSGAMLLFTTSGIFLPLETALNKVWSIEQNRSYLRNQAVSFLLTLTVGLLALSAILLIAAGEWLGRVPAGWMSTGGLVVWVPRGLLEAVLLLYIVSTYFVIYYVLPNGRVPARAVFRTAVVAGLVTEGGKFLYLITLPLFRFREVYGPFALSVTLLFWAFLGALVLLSGAHFSARIHLRDRVRPSPLGESRSQRGSAL